MDLFQKLSSVLFIVATAILINNPSCYGQVQTLEMPTPESYFGFTPGEDRMLFNYDEMIGYLQKLDGLSPKVKLEQIGYSELGRPMYLLFVSSGENIANLERLRGINRELALDHDLSDARRKELVDEGKVFFFMTLSMHANEVGPSQAAPLIVYELITSDEPENQGYS
jgi:hypothetical protein